MGRIFLSLLEVLLNVVVNEESAVDYLVVLTLGMKHLTGAHQSNHDGHSYLVVADNLPEGVGPL